MELILNIYEKTGKKIVRTAKGQSCDIMLGTIESIMEILGVDTMENNFDIITKVYQAYSEVRVILCNVFGDITDEEWKCVKLNEIIPVLLTIVKFTFKHMQEIPTDPN